MKDLKNPGKVVDLNAFRDKKKTDDALARGREPLYASYLDRGQPATLDDEPEDFSSRMNRIRTSLEKINQLMWELKKNSTDYH